MGKIVYRPNFRQLTGMARNLASGLGVTKLAGVKRKPRAKSKAKGKSKKLGKSKSHAKTRTSDENALEISQHNDLSEKKLHDVVIGTRKKLTKTVGYFTYRDVTQQMADQVQGYQSVEFLECVMTRNMLVGTLNANTNDRYALPDDLFLLNPSLSVSVNAIHNNTPFPAVFREDCIGLKSVIMKTKCLSLCTAPQKVSIYWLTPKYDTGINPNAQWSSILASKGSTQGTTATPKTTVGVTAVAGGQVPDVGFPGENPFQHKEFRKNWRCLQKSKFILQPGDQRHLSFAVHYNKVFVRNTFLNLRTAGEFLKNITIFPMVIVEGGLVGITPDTGTLTSEVAQAGPKVGFFCDYLYKFSGLPAPRVSAHREAMHVIAQTSQVARYIDDEDNVANYSKV